MSQLITTSGIMVRRPSFFRHWVIGPITAVFDIAWHVLAFIVGAVIIGGILVNIVISLITTGTLGVGDPRTWATFRLLVEQPLYSSLGLGVFLLLILFAYIGHRASHPPIPIKLGELADIYGVAPVVSAEPSNALIPSFNPAIYIPRRTIDQQNDADKAARDALHAALNRRDPTSHEGVYGLCVYGRKLLGTSRLAWEAMKQDVKHDRNFTRWTLVQWPNEPSHSGDLLKVLQAGDAQVVVWLENLADLALTNRHAQLSSLPFDLADAGIPFVVIATCEDGAGEKSARKIFGDLMDHLAPIQLADISRDEASRLVAELGRTSAGDHRDLYDGTPGSIVLAVTSMREEVYPRLPELAKKALQAIKLLRVAGIRDYPIKRVVATARDVFDAVGSDTDWDRALSGLQDAGFLAVQMVASALKPANDVYLDLAVPTLAASDTHGTFYWTRLKDSLGKERDQKALVRLGDLFRRHDNPLQAEECYRGALEGLTKETSADDWAHAQLGLGSILVGQIELSAERERAPLLEQAKTALEHALAVMTPGSDPTPWAEASGALATVYRIEAATGLDALIRHGGPTTRQRRIRGQVLESALAESRDALKVWKKETTPEEWAEAEYQLGLVYFVTAQLSWDARDRRAKLDTAIDAHRRALTVFTEGENSIKVARAERAMGDACRLRAEASNRPRKDEMLQQAISAYTHAIGISTARQLWSGDDLATLQTNLASCLRGLALLGEEPQRSSLLENAADTLRASSQGFDLEVSYVQRAEALRDLGQTLNDLAVQAELERKLNLLNEGLVAFTDAFKILGRRGTIALRAQLHLGLALLYWQRATNTNPPAPMDVVQAYANAKKAQHGLSAGEHAAELIEARKVARDAERKAKASQIALPRQSDDSSPRNQREAS
jgi:tetratricopeptide (TPR) repeat protein